MRAGLSTPAATGLYVGAVLGPGLLVTPSLVAAEAGPASVVAWGALLLLSVPLAATFAALGVRLPQAGGTSAYVEAAFGPRAGRLTAWLFLAGVLVGAPVVAFAGGRYIATLAGLGTVGAAAVAGAIVAAVVAVNGLGLSLAARVQAVMAVGLVALLVAAVATSLPHAHAASWAPFAPHGAGGVGAAASVLLFSFIGWEAVASLVGDLRDPARQLPRAVLGALAVVAALYAAIAVATVGVLGSSPSPTPVADLLRVGIGPVGGTAAIVLAAALTLGTMTTYVAGSLRLAGSLLGPHRALGRPTGALALFALAAAVLLALLAAGAVGVDGITRASCACFAAVYVLCTAAGARLLRGWLRAAAGASLVATATLLVLTGAALALPAAVVVVALAASAPRWPARRAPSAACAP